MFQNRNAFMNTESRPGVVFPVSLLVLVVMGLSLARGVLAQDGSHPGRPRDHVEDQAPSSGRLRPVFGSELHGVWWGVPELRGFEPIWIAGEVDSVWVVGRSGTVVLSDGRSWRYVATVPQTSRALAAEDGRMMFLSSNDDVQILHADGSIDTVPLGIDLHVERGAFCSGTPWLVGINGQGKGTAAFYNEDRVRISFTSEEYAFEFVDCSGESMVVAGNAIPGQQGWLFTYWEPSLPGWLHEFEQRGGVGVLAGTAASAKAIYVLRHHLGRAEIDVRGRLNEDDSYDPRDVGAADLSNLDASSTGVVWVGGVGGRISRLDDDQMSAMRFDDRGDIRMIVALDEHSGIAIVEGGGLRKFVVSSERSVYLPLLFHHR